MCSTLAQHVGKRVISFDLGSRSMAFAYVEYPCKILKMGLIDCGKHEARTATANLVHILETTHSWMRDCDADVVVEAQPSNGIIKSLSHVLQAYFLTVHHARPTKFTFDFMQANNKLKYNLEIYEEEKPNNGEERKVVTMRTLQEVILPQQEMPNFAVYYAQQKYKQKTDLADAVVQACRWLQIKYEPHNRVRKSKHKPSKNTFDLQQALREDEKEEPELEFID